jgi:hypothetical protein
MADENLKQQVKSLFDGLESLGLPDVDPVALDVSKLFVRPITERDIDLYVERLAQCAVPYEETLEQAFDALGRSFEAPLMDGFRR